ncbi:carbohydrate kinase, partial [Coemansia reversa NRRL 1564]
PVRAVIVMGVSGCGKTAIGSRIASMLGSAPFIDADTLHPLQNINKMAQGIALSDSDRWPWLRRVREQIDVEANMLLASRDAMLQHTYSTTNDSHTDDTVCPQLYVVCGCSALKRSYRELLFRNHPDEPVENQTYDIVFVYVSVVREELARRLEQRKDHFFDPSLLDSQLNTLEPPDCVREAAII